MTKVDFIKKVQEIGREHEKLLEIYAVQSARYPNNKQARADAEKYASYDRIARESTDKVISLIHGYLPDKWETSDG